MTLAYDHGMPQKIDLSKTKYHVIQYISGTHVGSNTFIMVISLFILNSSFYLYHDNSLSFASNAVFSDSIL